MYCFFFRSINNIPGTEKVIPSNIEKLKPLKYL